MPYYLFKISARDKLDLVKNLELLEVFDAFKAAKNEAKKVRKITGVSDPLNIIIASGTQASTGMGRKSSNSGKIYSLNFCDQPKNRPRGTPKAVARQNA